MACAKRLEKGRFRWPAAQEGRSITIARRTGNARERVDVAEARPRKNWLRRLPRHKTFKTFLPFWCKRDGNYSASTYNLTYSMIASDSILASPFSNAS